MLSSFKVAGFKSLLDATVELGTINVFIGSNGSGKSNLLEALGVIGAAAFSSVEPETLRYRGVRLGLPALYKTSFKEKKFRRVITLEATWKADLQAAVPAKAEQVDEAVYRLGLDNPIRSPAQRWGILSELLGEGKTPLVRRTHAGCIIHNSAGDPEYIHPPGDQTVAALALARRADATSARALINALKGFAIYSPNTPVLRGLGEDIARAPLGLLGGSLAGAVKDLMNRSDGTFGPFDLDDIWELIEWADDMMVVPSHQSSISPAVASHPIVLQFRDRFMRKERDKLSAYDASEGALYVLFMLALVAHPLAPKLFAVDNFDHGLHPRLAAALTRMVVKQVLADGACQALVTTHNPLVLDGLDLLDDRVRLFAVERGPSGPTQIRRIEVTPDLMERAEQGFSLSRLWVMGRLGGIPRSL